MAPLATVADVEESLGRPLTDVEQTRVNDLLIKASAAVESFTERKFAPGDYTVGRRPRGGRVRLPGAPSVVTGVRWVDHSDGSEGVIDDFTMRNSFVYGMRGYCFVEVDFTISGPVPDAVVSVVAGAVADLLRSPTVGLTSEMEGGYQAVYDKSSGRVWLGSSDKAILAKYRVPAPAIALP